MTGSGNIKRAFFFLPFSFLTFYLFSQTAQKIERLLGINAVSYGDAAQLALEAADVLAATTTTAAFSYALEQGWLPGRVEAGDSARLDTVSLLLMKSFDIQGGLFYRFTKNSHYAYRELVYLNVIQGIHDPSIAVSGDLLLFMVNRLLSYREVGQI